MIRLTLLMFVLYGLQILAFSLHRDGDFWFYSVFVTLGFACIVIEYGMRHLDHQIRMELPIHLR